MKLKQHGTKRKPSSTWILRVLGIYVQSLLHTQGYIQRGELGVSKKTFIVAPHRGDAIWTVKDLRASIGTTLERFAI